MNRELTKCDICGKEQYSDEKHSERSLHIKLKKSFTLWWWHRNASKTNIDICDECLSVIYSLVGISDSAKTLQKILKYRSGMCISDSEEFDEALKKIAKRIDRYKDNHKKIFNNNL